MNTNSKLCYTELEEMNMELELKKGYLVLETKTSDGIIKIRLLNYGINISRKKNLNSILEYIHYWNGQK